MIAATVLAHQARLVTKDERLRAFKAIHAIW
jgi:predicted nucleic acid-binding protein